MAEKKWTKAEYNRVIDELVESRNKNIGGIELVQVEQWRPQAYPLCHPDVTVEAIRKWADCIGDLNPLWREPAYGKKTRWGSTIVPPMGETIFGCQPGWPPMPKVPGWQQHPYGIDHKYFTVVRPGDTIRAFDKELGIKEITPPDPSLEPPEPDIPFRTFRSTSSRTFLNQRDEVTCVCTMHLRSVARFPGEEEPIPEKKIRRYSQEVFDEVHPSYEAELEGKRFFQRHQNPNTYFQGHVV